MDKQAIFNTVYKHLLTQNKKAIGYLGRCRYRTKDGLSCAIGCLIPDEIYDENFEGKDLSSLFENKDNFLNETQYQFMISLLDENSPFLRILQYIHDCIPVENWETILKDLAEIYNLTIPQL